MKKIFFVILFLGSFSFATPHTLAATFVSTDISGNVTWNAAGSPYVLTKRIFIPGTATLTIEAGTVVKVASDIIVSGTLRTEGTEESPIIFTSLKDDVAGDTNLDGTSTTPAPGQWLTISNGFAGKLIFTHTEIRYSGGYSLNARGALTSIGGPITLDHAYLHHSESALMRVLGSNAAVTVNNSRFEDVAEDGIVTNGGAVMTLRDNTFKNIAGFSIYNAHNSSLQRKVDAINNYWGSELGPEKLSRTRPDSSLVSNNVLVDPFLTTDPNNGCQTDCFSNVLFLPGIMGSRLYEAGEELWFSGSENSQLRMEMNSNGTSKNTVYTIPDTQRAAGEQGEPGVVDETANFNLYKSFLNDLQSWKAEELYTNYAFIPYDWRLSLNDIVMNGKVENGKLSYAINNTDLTQSFLYQQAKDLQLTSKSGKITLIGHSNGGLVIKAFVQKLKDENDPLYNQIDKVILVAVPQQGTPDAIVSMLYGTRIGLPLYGVAPETGRHLSRYMPSMYNLLPSDALVANLGAVIELEGEGIPESWKEEYGNTINSPAEFADFLTSKEGRQNPSSDDTEKPLVLSEMLLNNAKSTHQALNNWTPSPETEVIQIAGWGVYTREGLKIDSIKDCPLYKDGNSVRCRALNNTFSVQDKLTYRGDATVIAESALAMNEGVNVKQWWIDLYAYNKVTTSVLTERIKSKIHKDILEVDTLRPFIKCLLQNSICDTSADYISATEPAPLASPLTKYTIHSPLYLTVTDDQGNITGYNPATGEIEENIPGSQYFEAGEVKTVLLPEDTIHRVTLKAYDEGSFTFSAEKLVGDQITESTEFQAVPTLESSEVEVTKTAGKYTLKIDFEGDEVIDKELEAEPGQEANYNSSFAPDAPRFYYNNESKELSFKNAEHNKEVKTVTYTKDDIDYVLGYEIKEQSKTKLNITFITLSQNGVQKTDLKPINISFRSDQRKKNRPNLDITVTQGPQKFTVDYQQKGNKTLVKNWQRKKMTSKKVYKSIVTTNFYLHNEGISWEVSK